MAHMSEAKKKANKKWNDANMKERYDRVQLVLPKGRKAELQAEAERRGLSVNGMINSLIDEALRREAAPAPSQEATAAQTPEEGAGVISILEDGETNVDSNRRRISPLSQQLSPAEL